MRRKLIVGNWKMNGDRFSLGELEGIADIAARHPHVDVAICPPVTLIALAADAVPGLTIGAQDCHRLPRGPHTGCLSAGMLWEAGARLAIVGHSERRRDQGEHDADVCGKARAAIGTGMMAIVCVGETEAQRDAGKAIAAVSAQVDGSVPAGAQASELVVAYEPAWAVGTGRAASRADVATMHAAIRACLIAKLGRQGGEGVRILYGGSVTGGNAATLLGVANVDGGLIGGASLTAAAFAPIIAAAAAAADAG